MNAAAFIAFTRKASVTRKCLVPTHGLHFSQHRDERHLMGCSDSKCASIRFAQ